MSASVPVVAAVTATYRRPRQLEELLRSLDAEAPGLARIVVVDNAGDPALPALAASAPIPTDVFQPGSNLGCGGGVGCGLTRALRDPKVTHLWIFDDDAQACPGALARLLETLDQCDADAAVPLVVDTAGHIGWFPGPLRQPAWGVIRERGLTPSEFRSRCGAEPLAWRWSPWPSLMVTRRAVEAVGMPRADYWFQGEDLEWTLRISARFRCVLAPAAECRHLPPPGRPELSRLKHAAMLQNNLFTATRLWHGRAALRHAPGNAWRFLRAERFAWSAMKLVALAHWFGAVRGRPAGCAGADAFRRRWERLRSAEPGL